MTTNDQNQSAHRSGVAARLAGVPVDTLRIWERRYSVVGPRTSDGGQRLYTDEDIRRLTMIKQLVDLGHAIGTVAVLDTKVITAMQATTWTLREPRAAQLQPASVAEVSVVLIGAMLGTDQFAKTMSRSTLKLAGRCADPAKAISELADVRADIVIVELPMMRETDLERVAALKSNCAASAVIVLYRYASSVLVRRMRMAGHTVARATSDPAEVEAICLRISSHLPAVAGDTRPFDTLHLLELAQPRPPRFEEAFLAELAITSRTIACECPKHLVELVLNLGGFERYSAECASRSPADLALHRELERAAGLARSIMEHALERVAIAENIDLPAPEVRA